ncbi:unnamed protein product [Sphagnum jensenii]|uniref:Uncharacterized protein n=1 Tax=Sphagnum jensenii TaxID=128206 RepID=A0ABP1BKX7_9BRYO
MSLMSSSSSSTYGWVRGLRRRVFFFSAAATTGVFVCLLEEDSRQNSCSSSSGFAQLRRSIQDLFPAAAAAAHKPWQGTKGECERVEKSRKKKKKTRKDAQIMLAAVDTICKRNAEEAKQCNQITTQKETAIHPTAPNH